MEEFDISTASVVAHILITWIPWLIGIAMGGGLGALCALGIYATLSASPHVASSKVAGHAGFREGEFPSSAAWIGARHFQATRVPAICGVG